MTDFLKQQLQHRTTQVEEHLNAINVMKLREEEQRQATLLELLEMQLVLLHD